ncbi:MAG: GNAT family N-acetyltransferase [Deltaproteobacteria bacterium]|nr:GNAT family N-acetyltransferase [Deltaproteobacteria bacterium]
MKNEVDFSLARNAPCGVSGFLHPAYAQSLAEFGKPRLLTNCRGWILERPIPQSPYRDGMGLYPLFCCENWAALPADFSNLESELVSISLVTDPFGRFSLPELLKGFTVVKLFKEHYVADLHRSPESYVSPHHRYYSKKSLKKLHVEKCQQPLKHLTEWIELYGNLISRHNITGMRAFSLQCFEGVLEVPGLVMFRATNEERTVGALLLYLHGDFGYVFLSAFTDEGYRLRAAYALRWVAIQELAKDSRWLDMGAGAGLATGASDGLTTFKRGWASETKPVYFCGQIFDTGKYNEIVAAKGISRTDYFPAYRVGEFF